MNKKEHVLHRVGKQIDFMNFFDITPVNTMLSIDMVLDLLGENLLCSFFFIYYFVIIANYLNHITNILTIRGNYEP